MSRWFNLRKVFSLAGVANAASLRLDGDPTLPLVDTDWPETVVPQDLVAPPLETVAGFFSPSSWWLPPVTISSITPKLNPKQDMYEEKTQQK